MAELAKGIKDTKNRKVTDPNGIYSELTRLYNSFLHPGDRNTVIISLHLIINVNAPMYIAVMVLAW